LEKEEYKKELTNNNSPIIPFLKGDEKINFESSSEIELAKKIMQFDSVLKESIENNYPHIITSYAYSLTKAFSTFYNNVRVKETQDKNKKQLQLLLVDSFGQTLKETFEIL